MRTRGEPTGGVGCTSGLSHDEKEDKLVSG